MIHIFVKIVGLFGYKSVLYFSKSGEVVSGVLSPEIFKRCLSSKSYKPAEIVIDKAI
jgi:hypothetical protein